MELIVKYFPSLTKEQYAQFEKLYGLYLDWNSKINVVSRKDMEQLYLRHVLHSLAIARFCSFGSGASVLDVGSGGGFPGIPLAIMFPDADFTLVDSIGKKVSVIRGVSESLGLRNVTPVNSRVEAIDRKFDFVVSRAVTEMSAFVGWVWDKIRKGDGHGTLSNGILYLKGGDLSDELAKAGKPYVLYDISGEFEEDFFETKKVVYLKR